MAVQEKLYTAADLLELSAADDTKRYELVKGVLVEMSPTQRPHNALTVELLRLLANHVRSGRLGEIGGPDAGFTLTRDPDTVRSPDVSFVSKGRLTPMEDGYYTVAPDLAVEVASPGNSKTEIHEKVVEYFQAGTRLVWVVFPKSRAIYVYHAPNEITVLSGDEMLDGGDVLPGFSVKVRDLFAVLDS
jgi:Uma2 family endonuclease